MRILSTGAKCSKKTTKVVQGEHLCGVHARSQTLTLIKIDDGRARTVADWEARITEQVWAEEQAYVAWGKTLQDMGTYREQHPDEEDEPNLWLANFYAKENVEKQISRTKVILKRGRGIEKSLLATMVEQERRDAKLRHEGVSVQHRMRASAEILEQERVAEQIRIRLTAQPVTFSRDPVGDIALKAFANDGQNVHRSSIQNATVVSLQKIMAYDEGKRTGNDVISEIRCAFQSFRKCENVMEELQKDIFERKIVGFGFSYCDVLNHLWQMILAHVYKEELIVRLYQELLDGHQMCSNGKMCRLINVLQGYDEGIILSVSRDAFQHKFATLMDLPQQDRLFAAKAVLKDYSIPNEEWSNWIDPLMSV